MATTKPSRITLRRAATMAALALCLLAGAAWWEGGRLMAPAHAPVAKPSDLKFEAVSVPRDSRASLAGWFLRGRPGRGAVLLLHPLRANRMAMLGRARLLAGEGYSLLLIDFQAHGESPGSHLTFGWLESQDTRAALRYIHDRLPGERIGGIGISLGGASMLLGDQPVGLDAAVVEATYPTFEEGLDNRLRMRLGPLAPFAAPLLSLQLRPRLGISPSDLRPIGGAARIGCPLLVVAGTNDRHATLAQSRRLFAEARDPKEIWVVQGAGHEDFLSFDPRGYREHVLPFLAHQLRTAQPQS
ncbi:MAG: alpha/beta hydrolase [Acidobacteriota bacterium]